MRQYVKQRFLYPCRGRPDRLAFGNFQPSSPRCSTNNSHGFSTDKNEFANWLAFNRCGFVPRSLLRGSSFIYPQNDLAELLARFEPLLRLGGISERKNLIEHRFGACRFDKV